jgi:mono/diheme cytochrome c family protein
MRTTRSEFLVVAVAAAVIALVATAGDAPTPTPTPLPEPRIPAAVPESAKRMPNPREAHAESIDIGHRLFSSQCTMCHGAAGDGKGVLAGRLGMAVPDFGDPAVQKGRTDGEWFYILTHGHGRMPGEGERLPDSARWDMVNFMRTLRRTQ